MRYTLTYNPKPTGCVRWDKKLHAPVPPDEPGGLRISKSGETDQGMRINDWLLTIAQSSGKVWNAWTKRVRLRVSILI